MACVQPLSEPEGLCPSEPPRQVLGALGPQSAGAGRDLHAVTLQAPFAHQGGSRQHSHSGALYGRD